MTEHGGGEDLNDADSDVGLGFVGDNTILYETMKRRASLLFDRISNLPCNITQTILMCLPLEDMVRTSTLSKYWRFQWTKVPQLMFDSLKRRNVAMIFGIILQHEGPVFKCSLTNRCKPQKSEINHILRYLSRSGIQDLNISKHEVPTTIFSCVELKRLSLNAGTFTPITFDGFSKLITLELVEVELNSRLSISSCPVLESLRLDAITSIEMLSVDAPKLKFFYFQGILYRFGFMNTPLLEVLSLDGDSEAEITGTMNLMEFLCSLLRLETLLIHSIYLQGIPLSLGISPNNLPAMLTSVRKLELIDVTISHKYELSSILWIIKNSPNLLRLKFQQLYATKSTFKFGLNIQDYSGYHLKKLEELEMVFSGCSETLKPHLELMKFLLDVSPELVKLYIRPSSKQFDRKQQKMVLKLACYRRASPKAEIVLR